MYLVVRISNVRPNDEFIMRCLQNRKRLSGDLCLANVVIWPCLWGPLTFNFNIVTSYYKKLKASLLRGLDSLEIRIHPKTKDYALGPSYYKKL